MSAIQHATTFAKTAVSNLAVQEAHRRLAAKQVGKLMLAGLAGGAALRGGTGLYNLLRRNLLGGPAEPETSGVVRLPSKRREEEDKLAADSGYTFDVSSHSSVPWFYPAAFLGTFGAGAAGWKGVDWLLDKRRRQAQDSEQEEAQRDFEAALSSRFGGKAASIDPLDEAFDGVTKTAALPGWDWLKSQFTGDVGGKALGTYLTYAGASSILPALYMYQQAHRGSDRSLLEKALKRRASQRLKNRPPMITFEPNADEDEEITA